MILVSPKNISSNHLFSNFFSENVTFTKFFPKMCSNTQCSILQKNEKFTVTEKKFVKSTLQQIITLFSRNFCQKCVRLNHSNFHTVTLWDYDFYGKINIFPVKSTISPKLISRKFLSLIVFCSIFPHSQCGNLKNFPPRFFRKISSK